MYNFFWKYVVCKIKNRYTTVYKFGVSTIFETNDCFYSAAMHKIDQKW